MAKEVNYFLILELPFDPPENDKAKIIDAINKKRAFWTLHVNDLNKGVAYSEYIEQIDRIKTVMLDPDSRQEEAEKAKKIKKDNEKRLYDRLAIYRDKYVKAGQPLILDSDLLKKLFNVFCQFGFTKDEIQIAFSSNSVPIPVPMDSTCVISKNQANNLRRFMKNLGLSDKTLYDFFHLSPNVSNDAIHKAAQKLYVRLNSMGEKSPRIATEQNLCGLCNDIFRHPDGKIKYDNYINLTRWNAVNELIDEFALSNGKNIEPKMKEVAIGVAVQQYKLAVSDASIYIDNYCTYMGYSLLANTIICGYCNTENPAGMINCVKCGEALIVNCPSCGAQNNNSAKSCAKCGFDLTKMVEAVKALDEAKKKYAEKSLEEAKKLILKAKLWWPNHEEILSVESSILKSIDEQIKTIDLIMQDIQAHRIYAARTKIEQAKIKGFLIDEIISSRVSKILRDVEVGLSQARNACPEEAFQIFISLSEQIADSEELNNRLKNFPPQKSSNFVCQIVADTIVLSWSESSSVGNIEYHLVRKENTYPNNSKDGSEIYKGKSLEYTDSDIKKNVVYCYSIFVSRIGVFSEPTKSAQPLSIVEKIKNFKAVGGDGIVTLSWERDSELKEIRLWKYRGLERPQNDNLYEAVPCKRLDGFVVNSLQNGATYWFAISAGYILNGKSYFSEKVYLSSIPQKPAEPLQNFNVKLVNGVFQANWQYSDWDVILFYSTKEPDYVIGTIYDIDEISSEYGKINLNLKTLTEADFKINFVGECYIIPGVVNSSNVILNKFIYVSSVPCVKDVSFDLNSTADEMYVNFTWPRKIDRAMLVYRMDEYPKKFDDPLAKKIECNKRQYDANAGVLISSPAEGTFYFKIYVYLENNSRRIYSEGLEALFNNAPQRDIYYNFKYKQSGFFFFKKKCTLTVDIEASSSCVLPPFVIVSKFRSMPLRRDDGNIVCSSNESIAINNFHSLVFDVPPLNEGTRLKMFFLDDTKYKSFKLTCKFGSTI